MTVHTDHTFAVSEEVLPDTVPYRKHVIIEIKIFLIKSLDPMQMHLYRIAVECRKELFRNDVLVEHYIQLADINPLWNL